MITRNVNFASWNVKRKLLKFLRLARSTWTITSIEPRRYLRHLEGQVEVLAAISAGFSLIDRHYESVAGRWQINPFFERLIKMYYKTDSVSHHVTLERADLSCFTPLLYVDDNKSLSDVVPVKQRKSEVLGRTGDAHHDGGGKNDLWWQHFCFIYVFYNDQSPVLRDRVPFASIFHRIHPSTEGSR